MNPFPSKPGRARTAAWAIAAAVGLAVVAAPSQAAVVEYADIGGFRTFQDTTSGRVWVDLDARFAAPSGGITPPATHASYGDYLAALGMAGFTWASTQEVQALFDTLDFPNNASAAAMGTALAQVMTSAYADDESIMGIAQNSSAPTGQRRHGMTRSGSLRGWGTFASNVDFSATDLTNPVGLWAFMEAPPPGGGGGGGGGGAAVPEPGTLGLVALALGAFWWQRRRPADRPLR